jgi:hypothetical protein
MKKLLRYAVCVLLSFMAAAYAVSSALRAVLFVTHSIQHNSWLYYRGTDEFFVWHLLPVALSLWVCVIVWQLRKGPIAFPVEPERISSTRGRCTDELSDAGPISTRSQTPKVRHWSILPTQQRCIRLSDRKPSRRESLDRSKTLIAFPVAC